MQRATIVSYIKDVVNIDIEGKMTLCAHLRKRNLNVTYCFLFREDRIHTVSSEEPEKALLKLKMRSTSLSSIFQSIIENGGDGEEDGQYRLEVSAISNGEYEFNLLNKKHHVAQFVNTGHGIYRFYSNNPVMTLCDRSPIYNISRKTYRQILKIRNGMISDIQSLADVLTSLAFKKSFKEIIYH